MEWCECDEKRLVRNNRSCAFQSIAIAEMVILPMRMIILDWRSNSLLQEKGFIAS